MLSERERDFPAEITAPAPMHVVRLEGLLATTSGVPETIVGLIDGPVALTHPDLATENIRGTPDAVGALCSSPSSSACTHGIFVAGVLHGRRGSLAPAICPGCTLLLRPIFGETAASTRDDGLPDAAPKELAEAIIDVVEAGARVINLSIALMDRSFASDRALGEALHHAARRGAIVVAAAGNQGTVGSSAITRHPWVIPVVACNHTGAVVDPSNLGMSIGRHGLAAPGHNLISLCAAGGTMRLSGTSMAVPFVTGTIALLWSLFPTRSATEIKLMVTGSAGRPRRSVVPPLLDAAAAHRALAECHYVRRRVA